MNTATIYFDHPVHFSAGHALLIDIRHRDALPAERVALEMDAESARELARTILQVLDATPVDLIQDGVR
jgi:hypothetical protein